MKENVNLINYKNEYNDLKIFTSDNSHCILKEDWEENYKTNIRMFFEQSPSVYLYNCRVIIDYYLSIAIEISYYGFYTLYMNSNDTIKNMHIKNCANSLKSTKISEDVILSVFNLLENMERRNINILLFDYKFLGEKAYKIKAFAKSLYYFEKELLMNGDPTIIEKIILLFYELGSSESAFGVIKLAEEHQYDGIGNCDNKYIWYIDVHDYRKALDIIEEQLKNEYDKNKILILNKYKNICLYRLINLEKILLEDEREKNNNNMINEINENNMQNSVSEDKPVDKYCEVTDLVEKELFNSYVNISLDKWDELKIHISKINKKIKDNIENDDTLTIDNNDDFNNSDIIFIKNNENKNKFFRRSNEITVSDDYISYNNLILKNNDFFNKIDEYVIIDLNLISSLVWIMEGKYEIATKYKNDAKAIILYKIKSLLRESHSRGYRILIHNQEINYLEDIITYKQYHDGDLNYLEEMKKRWDKSFSKINVEPYLYIRTLYLYSFIFPAKGIFETKIKTANMYRKYGFFEQSKRFFTKYKKEINDIIKDEKNENNLIVLNEQKVKMEISYNKCLFENGEYDEAIKNGKILIDLLHENISNNYYPRINNELKGKIYGDYCLYLKNRLYIRRHKILNESKSIKKINQYYLIKSRGNLSPQLVHRNTFIFDNRVIILNEKNLPQRILSKNKEIIYSSIKNTENDIPFNDYFQSKFFKYSIKEVNIINHYFLLSTKYYKKNDKYWYNYCALNYDCYKYLQYKRIMSNELTVDYAKKVKLSLSFEISFAKNTIYAIKNCIAFDANNFDKNYQNYIRLIDIFFNLGGENEELLSDIFFVFYQCNLKIFVQILPLFLSRLGNKNVKILEKLVKAIVEICIQYPFESLIPLIITKYSSSNRRKSISNLILYFVEKRNPKLKNVIENYKIFVNELNKCSLLLHEKWKEAIEQASKMLLNKKYNNLVNQLKKVHKQMKEYPDNLYEINFNQHYYSQLKEAENYLNKYIQNPNDRYIREAWIEYQTVYNDMQSKYKNISAIYLEYISPSLSNIPENQIGLPGYFLLDKLYKETKQLIIGKTHDNCFTNDDKPIFLKKLDKYLYVLNTKQRPRKISFIGSDNKEYKYLLKSHEDLRQDERIIQVFNFVNCILSLDKITAKKNLLITVYPVIPLSHNTGLIGFLPNCDTISHLILDERKINNYIPNIEIQSTYKLCPKYDSSTFLNKVEIFKEVNKITSGYELNDIIWKKSVSCESWFIRKINYSSSLAVMSIVGYIIGLGDRHPNNLMMDRQSGKIIHIDFGDCFEIAMKRNKFPEKVPFRLTRLFVKALGTPKIEGIFRIISEKVMGLIKLNRSPLLAILDTLVYDPILSFRLMIPIVIKMKENENMNNKKINTDNISLDEEKINKTIISSSVMNNEYQFSKVMTFNLKINSNTIQEQTSTNIDQEKKEENNGEKEKDEKKRIENEERQILNYYEENDEIESEELNEIAQVVVNRIAQKLMGMVFNNDKPLDVKEQIDRLINQATSDENLAQSYLGWCPFW